MAQYVGLGVDPCNPGDTSTPALVRSVGCNSVRVVLRPGLRWYVDACHAAGLNVLGVITGESGDPEQYADWGCDWIEVGNEPDALPGTDGAWSLSPEEFYLLWYSCVMAFPPTVPLIIGGMASGSVERAGAYASVEFAAGLAIHPYDKGPVEAEALLRAYSAAYRLPLYVTEWNRPAEEIGPMMRALERTCEGWWWYAATQGMNPGFGLLDAPEKLAAWKEALSMPKFILGFATKAMELGSEVVGEPLEDEKYFPDGRTSLQVTSKGLMIYSKEANQVHFLPAAELPKA